MDASYIGVPRGSDQAQLGVELQGLRLIDACLYQDITQSSNRFLVGLRLKSRMAMVIVKQNRSPLVLRTGVIKPY